MKTRHFLAILALIYLVLFSAHAAAEPVAQAVAENGGVITFYTEPCELKSQVTNLPHKVRWVDPGGKTFEGCYRAVPEGRVVVAWFDDKTVALIPFGALKQVGNT